MADLLLSALPSSINRGWNRFVNPSTQEDLRKTALKKHRHRQHPQPQPPPTVANPHPHTPTQQPSSMLTTPKKIFSRLPFYSPLNFVRTRGSPAVSPQTSPARQDAAPATPYTPFTPKTPARRRYYAAADPFSPSPRIRPHKTREHRVGGVRNTRSLNELRKERSFHAIEKDQALSRARETSQFPHLNERVGLVMGAVQRPSTITSEDHVFTEQFHQLGLDLDHLLATKGGDTATPTDPTDPEAQDQAPATPIPKANYEIRRERERLERLARQKEARERVLREALKEEEERRRQAELRRQREKAEFERRKRELEVLEKRERLRRIAEEERKIADLIRQRQEEEASRRAAAARAEEERRAHQQHAAQERLHQAWAAREAERLRHVHEEHLRKVAADLEKQRAERAHREAVEAARAEAERLSKHYAELQAQREAAARVEMEARMQAEQDARVRAQMEARLQEQQAHFAQITAALHERMRQLVAEAQAAAEASVAHAAWQQFLHAQHEANREQEKYWYQQQQQAQQEQQQRAQYEQQQAHYQQQQAYFEQQRAFYEQQRQEQARYQQYDTDIPMGEPSIRLERDASMHDVQDDTPPQTSQASQTPPPTRPASPISQASQTPPPRPASPVSPESQTTPPTRPASPVSPASPISPPPPSTPSTSPPPYSSPTPPPAPSTPLEWYKHHEACYDNFRRGVVPQTFREVPWPVFGFVDSIDDLVKERIWEYVFNPHRPGHEKRNRRMMATHEVRKWHTDKFFPAVLAKADPALQAAIEAAANVVTDYLVQERNKS
ncbi:unnamed protein product [Cyclocybe aegerita]|uniref:Uncharacterized protein n=1 Tax=Cyclocybe aegerita TaxID=1973307 RepID=A0A8S0WQP6_CYCAE|nr:unnamed protein product [Cyclocybe aegerita]